VGASTHNAECLKVALNEDPRENSGVVTIFISWSGQRSGNFAAEFKPWLEQVLPGTDVWLSIDDIEKGDVWFTEIIDGLKNCHCDVVCVTRENHLAPWLHFEAGGMVKGLGKSHVAVVALDMEFDELRQPLSLFNALHLNRLGAWHLVRSFNKLSDRPINDRVLERTFEKFWQTSMRSIASCSRNRTRKPSNPSRCILRRSLAKHCLGARLWPSPNVVAGLKKMNRKQGCLTA
jgi:hypothetical protein